jgi:citrate lyase subunit beta/citryl-CoA lyase
VNLLRSVLYVPGDRPDRFDKAIASGADAVLIDMEDSVTPERKPRARADAAAWLRTRQGTSARRGTCAGVRVNGPRDSAALHADLAAIVSSAPDFVVVPKVDTARQLVEVAAVLGFLESQAAFTTPIALVPIIESAAAVAGVEAIVHASDRIAGVVCGAGLGGDVNRSVGYRWTAAGLETLYLRSRVLLAARAVGLRYPLYSGWMDLHDLDAMAADAEQNRDLGYVGQAVIHPSHVAVANRVYGPAPAEVERSRRLVAAYEAALAQGRSVADFEGQMIDRAMALTAAAVLAAAVGTGPPQ